MTRQRQLFRTEAIDYQQHQRQWGDVASLQPLSIKVTVWLLVIVTLGLIAFMFFAEYARKETAIGYLTPTKGTAKIFASRRGSIKEVHVEEGSFVREGQPLLTIETDQIAADGSDVNVLLLDTLASQKDQLGKNIRAEEQRTASERDRLTALGRSLEAEIVQLQAQLKIQSQTLKVVESEFTAAEQLRSKGFMTAPDFRRREIAVLDQRQAVSGVTQQVAAKQSQLTEIRFSLAQLPTVMAQKVQNLRNELATTDQRLTEVKGRGAYVIRAPASGRISTLQARAGQSAAPERLQLEIIPEDAVLHAELYVPARAIGFVEAGQVVRILYEAFPYQHFGTYRGQVAKVSQTILTSADAGGPIQLKEPAYRVIATLERPEIDAYGKKIPLQPDMLLKADIILERRSLVSWLTNPLRSVRM